jgi:hypothetical protein
MRCAEKCKAFSSWCQAYEFRYDLLEETANRKQGQFCYAYIGEGKEDKAINSIQAENDRLSNFDGNNLWMPLIEGKPTQASPAVFDHGLSGVTEIGQAPPLKDYHGHDYSSGDVNTGFTCPIPDKKCMCAFWLYTPTVAFPTPRPTPPPHQIGWSVSASVAGNNSDAHGYVYDDGSRPAFKYDDGSPPGASPDERLKSLVKNHESGMKGPLGKNNSSSSTNGTTSRTNTTLQQHYNTTLHYNSTAARTSATTTTTTPPLTTTTTPPFRQSSSVVPPALLEVEEEDGNNDKDDADERDGSSRTYTYIVHADGFRPLKRISIH